MGTYYWFMEVVPAFYDPPFYCHMMFTHCMYSSQGVVQETMWLLWVEFVGKVTGVEVNEGMAATGQAEDNPT